MTEELRFIKQRSPQWFKVREQFRLTGSSLHEGLGLESLKLQQKHFNKHKLQRYCHSIIPI